MARENDPWKRYREREEEREKEEAQAKAKKAGINLDNEGPLLTEELLKKVDEYFKRAPSLIDQVDSLYRQFITGLKDRPPLEERGRLEQLMATLFNMPKPTPAERFRFNNLQAAYSTHKQKWDKLLSDLESGKIKRTVGPKRGSGSGTF